MDSIKDWAMDAATQIKLEWLRFLAEDPILYIHTRVVEQNMNIARIKAIILEHCPFEPDVAYMRVILTESKRVHLHCDDSWYCCGKCQHPDHRLIEDEFLDSHQGEAARKSGICNCGADEWNSRVDEALLSGS